MSQNAPPNAQPTPRPILDSVDRTVRILRAFGAEEDLMLADVARRAGLSEATALRYLSSLGHFGLVQRTPSSRYRLGWEVFRLGQLVVANRFPRELALPVMERLLDEFNETVNVALREGDDLVIAEVLQSTRGLKKVNEVGQHDPWHASALGKAMLARMPVAERHALVERHGLARLTKSTITDLAALDEDLERSLERGYAIDDEEAEDQLTCVAAAVVDATGEPLFALSVSFLKHRLEDRGLDYAGQALAAAARDLQERLGHGAHPAV
jgi:IclR family acetate operon transcriptional repressor